MRLFLTFLFCGTSLIWGQDDYFLVINPDGHKSQIYTSDLDSKGNLITGGFDKTIKVWDTKRGKVKKEFLGQIGIGSEGMIYALDVSPDDKYLACGGWLGLDDGSENLGDIRIYDYKSGKLLQVLHYHEDVISGLQFTKSGQTLVSADASGRIAKWDVSSGKQLLTYQNESNDVQDLSMGPDYFVTGHEDGLIQLWDLNKPTAEKKVKAFAKAKHMLISSYTGVSPDGSKIVGIGKQIAMIIVMDTKMKAQQFFFSETGKALDAVFAPSGNRMAVIIKEGDNHRVEIYDLQGEEWKLTSTYRRHNDLIASAEFQDENTVISTGGKNNEIAVWKIIPGKSEPEELMWIEGVGRSNYSAAMAGKELAFSKVPNKAYGDADYREVFHLFERQLDSIISTQTQFVYPQKERGAWKLKEEAPVRKTEWDPVEVLYLYKNGIKNDSINKYPEDGNRFGTYSFVNDEFFVTGCDYGIMEAYDYDGVLLSRFVGHEGAVRSLTVSDNGKFIVSSGLDMTIRIWRVSDVGKLRPGGTLPTIWNYCDQMEVGPTFQSIFKQIGVEAASKSTRPEDWRTVLRKMKLSQIPCGFLETKYGEEMSNYVYPVASFFMAENGEWVLWNQDGYFTSSKRGARYVGYHLNQGRDKEAKFYPFDQFDLKYNRPDILMKDLEVADAGVLELYEKAYKKRLKRMGMSEDDLKADIQAPELRIESFEVNGAKAKIKIGAEDYKYGLDRLYVYVNDVPIYGRTGIDLSKDNSRFIDKDLDVALMAGDNRVQVSVLNKNGVESFRETVNIHSDQAEGNLYIACIGVSNYADKNYTLNYAAKDAIDLATTFDNCGVYKSINQKVLTDNEVTREHILSLKNFFAQAGPNDVVALFIAGHGVLNKDLDYYYGTYDMDFLQPEGRGISYTELETLFDGIKAIRKLLIMDTCHSGELDKDDVEEVAAVETVEEDVVFRSSKATTTVRERQGLKKTNEAVKEMFNDLNRGTGTTVISSAGGVEFAMESDQWNNGLFTFCFLDGLKNRSADLNKDGVIYISELQQFVGNRVAELSNGKQMPSARFENISLDYPIW